MVKPNLSSTISSKGQITVPLEVRRRLGLKKGDRVEFVITRDNTLIRPAQFAANPFEKYIGILPGFRDRREIRNWIAQLREDDRG